MMFGDGGENLKPCVPGERATLGGFADGQIASPIKSKRYTNVEASSSMSIRLVIHFDQMYETMSASC